MMRVSCSLMSLLVVAAAGGGCESRGRIEAPATPPASDSQAAGCDASRVKWAIGELPSTELLERARREAAADRARFLRHDELITMEFIGSRLNLELDERGRIRSARCG